MYSLITMKQNLTRGSLLPATLLLWLCLVTGPVNANDLDEIVSLSRSGTPELALHLLEQNQPAPVQDLSEWMRWERQRIRIYQEHEEWTSLTDRVDQVRKQSLAQAGVSLPLGFQRWLLWQQAQASLRQGESMRALILARQLLWESLPQTLMDGAESTEEDVAVPIPDVRQLIIEVYLAQQRVADAHTAMVRYRQDYPERQAQWRTLYARILLQLGRAGEVEELLKKDKSMEAQILYYQAQMQGNRLTLDKIRSKLRALARVKGTGERERYQLWRLLAQASRLAGDLESEINYLIKSQAVSFQANINLDGQPDVDEMHIWSALNNYGRQLGNEMQLLTGNHQAWMEQAQQLQQKSTIKAAALYAVLLDELTDAVQRTEVHALFTNLLARERYGYPLIRHLYVERQDMSAQKTRVEDLPDTIRHRLVDDALLHSDIKLASRLMGDLEHPPQGKDLFSWNLRRARILIMGGRLDRGVAVLYELLEKPEAIPATGRDKLVQVVFDLQSANRHEDAIAMFTRLLQISPEAARSTATRQKDKKAAQDARWRREMYYWIADSCKALARHQEAARMYLRSAMWIEDATMDPWAQSARYQAADALAKAGFRDDAASLYRGLLRVTKDPGRRTVLQNRIQQLWLLPVQGRDEQSVQDHDLVIH